MGARLSIKLMTLVWEIPMGTPAEKLVLLKLADHSNDDGTSVRPSKLKLAEKCCLDRRTVQRAMEKFEEQKILVLVAEVTGHPTLYRLDVALLKKLHSEANGGAAECHTRKINRGGDKPQGVWCDTAQSVIYPSGEEKEERADALEKGTEPETDPPPGERPTETQVRDRCLHLGRDPARGQEFWLNYESVGWVHGSATIVNWHRRLDLWFAHPGRQKRGREIVLRPAADGDREHPKAGIDYHLKPDRENPERIIEFLAVNGLHTDVRFDRDDWYLSRGKHPPDRSLPL